MNWARMSGVESSKQSQGIEVVEYRGCRIVIFPLGDGRHFSARISEEGREWEFPWHRSSVMGLPFIERKREKTLRQAQARIDQELRDRAVSKALGVEWNSPFLPSNPPPRPKKPARPTYRYEP